MEAREKPWELSAYNCEIRNSKKVDISQKKIFSVSQLTGLIKTSLEEGFRDIWVEGELTNLKQPSSGHLYFTLKDKTSQIRGVMFRSMGRFLRFTPKDGQGVLCRGRLSVYEPRGDYQIIVEYLEPRGIGALQLAFEELKERLAREGLFDESRKKSLPVFPQTIGVITSPTGAAIQDILHVLERRRGGMRVVLYPVRVQGESASKEISQALEDLNHMGGIDVIILGRGGGSLEDLWAFNEEVVARAIFQSNLPIISAVGHETDFTISDFVADLRAPTPSAAAEMVSKSRDEWLEQFQTFLLRLKQAVRIHLETKKGRLNERVGRLLDPRARIEGFLQRVDDLEGRLHLGLQHMMLDRKRRLFTLEQGLRHLNPVEAIQKSYLSLGQLIQRLGDQMQSTLVAKQKLFGEVMAKLNVLSPLSVLERGYSITWRIPSLQVLKDAETIQPGERVKVRLFRGELLCRTEEVFPKGSDQDVQQSS